MTILYSESLYEIVLNERSGIISNSEAPNFDKAEITARKHKIFFIRFSLLLPYSTLR
jgi:hypothetical protein